MDPNKNEGLITGIPDHLKPEPVETTEPVVPEIAPMPDGTEEMLKEIEDSRNRDQAAREAQAAEVAKDIADTMPEFEKPIEQPVDQHPMIEVPADVTESLERESSEAQARADAQAAEAAEVAKRIADTMPKPNEQ